jgi:NADPH-dependent 2,4-dienoyl-CoA reductase/sulfur reductase-like enzyme
MTDSRPVVVLGAGPAGLAAAQTAARRTRVLLVDAEPAVGGQYARQSSLTAVTDRLDPRIEHLPATTVWAIERRPQGARLHLRSGPADAPGSRGRVLDADALVLATGAHDRTLPFPGWDLPGVYTAGAAQALAKGQHVAIGRRLLIAGTGPFLLPVATSLLAVGAEVVGVLEANAAATVLRAWGRPPATLWAGRGKVGELGHYLQALAAHRGGYRHAAAVVAAHAQAGRLASVTVARLNRDWTIRPGSRRRVAVDAVCVSHGFVPRLECAIAAGCELVDGFVRVDECQATSVPGVFAAGEITGIGGADLAAAEGRVAGVAAAAYLAGRPVGAGEENAGADVARGRRFAGTLAAAYPVQPGWRTWLTDDTIVCRCEEVSVAGLRAAQARLGGLGGPRTVKLTSRVALGPCQGRICGRTVADLVPGLDPLFADRRPLATPVRLGDLAGTPVEPDDPGETAEPAKDAEEGADES